MDSQPLTQTPRLYEAYTLRGQSKNECCSLDSLKPNNWTARDVAKAALITFVVSLLLLTVASLSHHYPAASGSFLTIFSLGTTISAIVMLAAFIKYRKGVHTDSTNERTPPATPIKSDNPFDTTGTEETH